jgi:hypothetical protein
VRGVRDDRCDSGVDRDALRRQSLEAKICLRERAFDQRAQTGLECVEPLPRETDLS